MKIAAAGVRCFSQRAPSQIAPILTATRRCYPAQLAHRWQQPHSTSPRFLHSASPLRLSILSAQTHESAKSWNLAARLGSLDELEELSAWLATFKKDAIPAGTFQLSHARSSGKGGQNVNKVNTKVDLRFHLEQARWLPVLARKCLREAEKGRVNAAGEFVMTSERFRTQGENMEDCIEKLYTMIQQACELPKATDAAKVERIKKLEDVQKQRRRQEKDRSKDRKSSRRDWKD